MGQGGAVIIPPKDNSDAEEVRRRLALVREWKGMNKVEFARAAGIGPTLWNRIENGKRPISHIAAKKLKAAFSVPFDWLYDGDITDLMPAGLLKHITTKAHRN